MIQQVVDCDIVVDEQREVSGQGLVVSVVTSFVSPGLLEGITAHSTRADENFSLLSALSLLVFNQAATSSANDFSTVDERDHDNCVITDHDNRRVGGDLGAIRVPVPLLFCSFLFTSV